VRGLEPAMFGRELYGSRVLTKTEQRVIELVARGLKNSEVAEATGTTETTSAVVPSVLCMLELSCMTGQLPLLREDQSTHFALKGTTGAEFCQLRRFRLGLFLFLLLL
jgi:hypothetical protein